MREAGPRALHRCPRSPAGRGTHMARGSDRLPLSGSSRGLRHLPPPPQAFRSRHLSLLSGCFEFGKLQLRLVCLGPSQPCRTWGIPGAQGVQAQVPSWLMHTNPPLVLIPVRARALLTPAQDSPSPLLAGTERDQSTVRTRPEGAGWPCCSLRVVTTIWWAHSF